MAQAQCRICKQTKDSTFDFYWNKKGRQGHCKECQRQYNKAWNQGIRERIAKKKMGKTC